MPGATRLLRRTLALPALAGGVLLTGASSSGIATPLSDAARADSLALEAAAALRSANQPSAPLADTLAVVTPPATRSTSEDAAPPPPAAGQTSQAGESEAGIVISAPASVPGLTAIPSDDLLAAEPVVPPSCSLATYTQVGEASWYGPDFHGLPTASGETFDALALTVAHPNLPLGSVVEIKNLDNGRRAFARVNDRGPFLKDRIVDCSFAVAHMLGFVAQGLARVQVTVLDSLAVAPPLVPGAGVAIAAMEHLPPLRLANAIVSRTAVHVPPGAATVPEVVAAASSTEVRKATVVSAITRKASVLPFPAIVHAYRHLLHLVMGPYGQWDPARGARVKLETFGLRDFVHLFTD